MPLLSRLAQTLKARFLLRRIPRGARVLEVGCGDGWVGRRLRARGDVEHVGLDLVPPADVVGSILDWEQLGLQPGSFDAVVAFEVAEHVDCFDACWALLRPGGMLLVTTPVPQRDPLLQRLERWGLNQPRTSPHDHLVKLDDVAWDGERRVWVVAGVSQWGVFWRSG